MAPAERIDLIFDFSAHAGDSILLRSDSFEIMQFRVAAKAATDTSSLPPTLRSMEKIPENRAVKTRRLTLDERMDPVQQSMGMLLNNTPWHMPVTEKPVLNTTEIWEFVNLTEDAHPIHLHLVRFQILDRRPFDTYEFQDKGTVRFTGPAIPPASTESGWKDTVRAEPGLITRIIIPFEGFAGRYVWHCHILEHEDNEMMRPYEVVEATK
jgi:spore coat protein A